MQRLQMFQADAFASTLFGGNPAAVLILDAPLADDAMQAIAAENNLSETAFVTRDRDGWSIRWFTPTHEAAFCGHATVAAGHVLAAELGEGTSFRFRTRRVGELHLRVTGPGRYALDLPRLDPEPLDALPPGLLPMFAQPPAAVFRNFENLFAELADGEDVRAFRPDLAAISRLGEQGLCVTSRGGTLPGGKGADFSSRYFAPGAGIPEDPVTGSTHATLVPWWSERLGRARMEAAQASARGGHLTCTLHNRHVSVEGGAVTYLRGEIVLP